MVLKLRSKYNYILHIILKKIGLIAYFFFFLPNFSKFPNLYFEGSDRNSLSACIKVIAYLLEHISVNRKDEFNNDLDNLLKTNVANETIEKIISNQIKYK